MSDGTANVKIGYAVDPNKRLKTLRTGNPNLKIELTKPGSVLDEKALQKICKPYHYKREWFIDCEEVRKAFNEYDAFSDQELQKLKDWVNEKSSDLTELCHKESFIEEKLDGLDLKDLPEEWHSWLEFYKDRILYSEALSSIRWLELNTSCLKPKYKININNVVLYPVEKLKELLTKLDKGIDLYNSEIDRRKELKEDLYNVKNISTRNVLEYEIKQIDKYLPEKSEQINKMKGFVKEITDYLDNF